MGAGDAAPSALCDSLFRAGPYLGSARPPMGRLRGRALHLRRGRVGIGSRVSEIRGPGGRFDSAQTATGAGGRRLGVRGDVTVAVTLLASISCGHRHTFVGQSRAV